MPQTQNNPGRALLNISLAPHVKSPQSIAVIMWMVALSLMPAAVYSVFIFGSRALLLYVSCVTAALAGEAFFQFVMKKRITVADGSAAVTGILLAMNLPPSVPLWAAVIGSLFAVVIVKQLFGGLGFNIFNPALAARAFLMASWPVYMTTGWHRFESGAVFSGSIRNTGIPRAAFDALSGATPLAVIKNGPAFYNLSASKFDSVIFSGDAFYSLFTGNIGGVIGETSALFLLAGAAFLLWKRIITWHIPFSFMGTVFVLFFAYYFFSGRTSPINASLFHLLSGGLVLGAFFMATDMVTSPVSAKGMLIFGCGCGIITFVIRLWGGYPEGVSYSILLMNAVVPLIDRLIKPRVFGKNKSGEKSAS